MGRNSGCGSGIVLENLLHQAIEIVQTRRTLDRTDNPWVVPGRAFLAGEENDGKRTFPFPIAVFGHFFESPLVHDEKLRTKPWVLLLQLSKGFGQQHLVPETA